MLGVRTKQSTLILHFHLKSHIQHTAYCCNISLHIEIETRLTVKMKTIENEGNSWKVDKK